MKTHAALLSVLVITAITAPSCSRSGSRELREMAPPQQAAPAADAEVMRVAGGAAPPPASRPPSATKLPAPVPTERKVIRNGSIDIEVSSLDEALAALRAEVTRAGGYVAEETQSRGDGTSRRATVTVRLPADTLDASLERLQRLGSVEGLNVAAEDITEQYFNLELRLRNQQQLETRLLSLLDRPTNRLTELLEIEREVARVRGEIDELEGRRRLWDSQVAYSRLVVTLHEPVPIGRSGVFERLRGAVRESAENFVNAVAGLIALSGGLVPVLVVLALVWWAVRALWRWRR